MQGVILAAGKGTRLHPLTLARTKAMAPVAGKPLVGRVLATLAAQGVDDVIVVVSPQDGEIRGALGNGRGYGVSLRYVEQQERLGMAHALGLAAPWLDGPFVLSACDNLVPAAHVGELLAAHRTRQAAATLSLMPVTLDQVSKTGVVVWDDPWVRRIVEKPQPHEAPSTISSLPLYVLGPDVLALLPEVKPSPRGEYELQDALQMLMERGGRVTGVFTTNRLQVTTAADLLALNLAYLELEADQASGLAKSEIVDVTVIPPVLVEAGARIGPGCRLGPRVFVERDAEVGAGAVLMDCMVMRRATVAPGAQVSGELIAARETVPVADAQLAEYSKNL